MMKLYKNKFTKEQMNILNTIEIQSQRERYMSIFAYMIKHANKDTGVLEMSLHKLEKIDGKNIYTFKYTEEGNNNENL